MDSRQCICWIAGAILFVLFIAYSLSILLKRLTKHHNSKDSAMYYIEGTIDSIDIHRGIIRFSLLPANAFLLSLDEGGKKALFIDSFDASARQASDAPKKKTSATSAKLVEPDKNVAGKECLWFSIEISYLPVLTAAKSDHSQIRVWCTGLEKKGNAADEPTPPHDTFEAKGIRLL